MRVEKWLALITVTDPPPAYGRKLVLVENPEISRHAAMKRIRIVPLGDCDADVPERLVKVLEETFHERVETGSAIVLPGSAYDPVRGQYHGTAILENIRTIRPSGVRCCLGVTGSDLFVPGLNFVFGEADTVSGVALISLARLREEFYGAPKDDELFLARVAKEAVHEIGHTFGLGHCNSPACVMHFSNSLADADKKGESLCPACRAEAGP
jgi:archaemetzincin